MESSGKRLLLAVSLALGIMLAWQMIFPPKPPEPKKVDTASLTPALTGTTTAEANTPEPTAAAPRGPENVETVEGPGYRAKVSSYGGAIVSWELTDGQFVDAKTKTAENLVRAKEEDLSIFRVLFPDSTHQIPAKSEWKLVERKGSELHYQYDMPQMVVDKYFRFDPSSYVVSLTVDVKVKEGTAKQTLLVALGSAQDPGTVKGGGWGQMPRQWEAACNLGSTIHHGQIKDLRKNSTPKTYTGDVRWAGFVFPYFMAAAALEPKGEEVVCSMIAKAPPEGGMDVTVRYPTVELQQGTTYRRQLTAYMGPKYLDHLRAVATTAGWQSTNLENSIDLGWFGFIVGPLLWLLRWFYGFIGNWGLSIIALTVLVKIATLYWTHKSMKSMKEMAKLKPHLDKIKEKYPDDKQKQQVETMNLFKSHGVNPLAGCLPMLLQAPLWFAMYKCFSVAAELYHGHFLWITDLTAPDPLHILPVFLCGMMIVQAKMQPTTMVGAQQKMMTYGLPLMFGAMSFMFPAGLNLYSCTNAILTFGHSLFVKLQDEKAGPVVSKAMVKLPETGSSGDGLALQTSGGNAGQAGKNTGGKSAGNKTNKNGGKKSKK